MSDKREERSKRRLLLAVGLCAAAVATAVIGYGSLYESSAEIANETEGDYYIVDEDHMHDIIDDLTAYKIEGDAEDGEIEEAEVTVIETTTLEQLVAAVTDLEKQVASMEKRLAAEEADTAEVEKYSSFEIAGPKSPAKNSALPGVFIEYRGRTLYKLKFDIRVNSIIADWGNIIHVGDADFNRCPALWTFPNQRRILIHQSLEGTMNAHGYSTKPCEPSESVTPANGEYFNIEVIAGAHRFEVKYNGQTRCSFENDIIPLVGRHNVWFSNPFHGVAQATVKNLKFEITN